eukprot:scaffold71837_cov43-Phaeocystis_antarctica.AAC.2
MALLTMASCSASAPPPCSVRQKMPACSNGVRWAAWEADRSSTRGSGWAPRGPASSWEYQNHTEPSGAP